MPVVNTNSTLATALAAAALQYPTTEVADGEILFAMPPIKVTMPATFDATHTLTLVPASACPVGAQLDPLLCSVYAVTDPGTSLTLDIGTVADPDKFADALVLTQAGSDAEPGTSVVRKRGKVGFDQSDTAPVAIAAPYRFTTQEAIIATCMAQTSLSETVLVFNLVFRAKA